MEYTKNWNDLPPRIKEQLADANVFYSYEWYTYNKKRKEEMIYLWNDEYILAVRVKVVFFLKGGILDTEPFCICSADTFDRQQFFLDECCSVLKKKRLAFLLFQCLRNEIRKDWQIGSRRKSLLILCPIQRMPLFLAQETTCSHWKIAPTRI